MAAFVRLRALVAAIIVLGVAAGVALALTGESGPAKQVVARRTPSALPTQEPAGQAPGGHSVDVPGATQADAIRVQTVSEGAGGRTVEQVVTWRADGRAMTQRFPAVLHQNPTVRQQMGALMGPFDDENAAVISGIQQTRNGKRDLGIVYDATAYGSGSPTTHFVLLRLGGDEWKLIWDVEQAANWRGSHGRIEFPNGDLSELVVHSDDFSEGSDALSAVIFEANAGPHRAFVDTWVRLGDGYTLAGAVTVPSAYATLVQFLYALGTGGDATARALVTDAALVDEARRGGLGAWAGKNWGIACPVGDCGVQAGPIGFDPQRYHGEPNVLVSFTDQNSQWLISGITKTP